MSQVMARQLLTLIRDDFDVAQRDNHIPVDLEFCLGLRMYFSGGYQASIGHDNFSSMVQSSVIRILDKLTNFLLTLADRLIYIPKTRREREEISDRGDKFFNIYSFNSFICSHSIRDCYIIVPSGTQG